MTIPTLQETGAFIWEPWEERVVPMTILGAPVQIVDREEEKRPKAGISVDELPPLRIIDHALLTRVRREIRENGFVRIYL
jgi:hypothetical protein